MNGFLGMIQTMTGIVINRTIACADVVPTRRGAWTSNRTDSKIFKYIPIITSAKISQSFYK